jgi:hypothetical protein
MSSVQFGGRTGSHDFAATSILRIEQAIGYSAAMAEPKPFNHSNADARRLDSKLGHAT